MKNIALVLGGGASTRCGFDKLFAEKFDEPVLYKTLAIFENSREINEIVLVLNQKHQDFEQEIYTKFKKVKNIVLGGNERFFSLKNGVKFISHKLSRKSLLALSPIKRDLNCVLDKAENLRIIVHNGANPFLNINDLEAGIKLAKTKKNVIFGFFTTDSIKQVKNGKVCNFLNRDEIFQTQTPQISDLTTFLKALDFCEKQLNLKTTNLILPRDEAELLALINEDIFIYECSRDNTKITFKEDFK